MVFMVQWRRWVSIGVLKIQWLVVIGAFIGDDTTANAILIITGWMAGAATSTEGPKDDRTEVERDCKPGSSEHAFTYRN